MLHEQAGVILELGPHRQIAGLDHAFVGTHGRDRHVGIIDAPHVRSRFQTGAGIVIARHLEIVDVDVDGMLVVVLVDEGPLFNRTEPRLKQGNVGKRTAFVPINERLWIGRACQIVEKSARYDKRPVEVWRDLGNVLERGVGAERLSGLERRRDTLASRWHGARQNLRREKEEPVEIADS